jgi:hypothetical protein
MRRRWVAGVASLVTLVACADIWSFHDLTPIPEPTFVVGDATTTPDSGHPATMGDGAIDATSVDDGAALTDDALDDATLGDDAADAAGDAIGDAIGDATSADVQDAPSQGSLPETGSPSDGAADAIAECRSICSGCCDTMGRCQLGNATDVCGVGGALCGTCAGQSCIITSSPCCKSTGSCGCEVITGAFGCN